MPCAARLMPRHAHGRQTAYRQWAVKTDLAAVNNDPSVVRMGTEYGQLGQFPPPTFVEKTRVKRRPTPRILSIKITFAAARYCETTSLENIR